MLRMFSDWVTGLTTAI